MVAWIVSSSCSVSLLMTVALVAICQACDTSKSRTVASVGLDAHTPTFGATLLEALPIGASLRDSPSCVMLFRISPGVTT